MKVDNRKFRVYIHTTPDDRVYVGMTCQDPEKRWANGDGYINNPQFHQAIKEFGWNNIKHEVLDYALTKEDAARLERELIEEYNSTDSAFGFNRYDGGEMGAVGTGQSIYCVETDTLYVNKSAAAADLGLSACSMYHGGKHRGLTFVELDNEEQVENYKMFSELEQYEGLAGMSAEDLTDDICSLLFGD